jgi:glycerol-3-phosphate cytidylyltransferase
MTIVITFGTYDLFHIGHLNIIKRCKTHCDILIVGISTDNLNFNKKQKYPVYNQYDRLNILNNIKGVDQVFFEESLEKKREYILKYKADILIMGDDWKGKFDEYNDICKVIYLPRTPNISSTSIKEYITKYS